jgi:hypothetical protein
MVNLHIQRHLRSEIWRILVTQTLSREQELNQNNQQQVKQYWRYLLKNEDNNGVN